jgi:exopolyphosphatase/guanosine-5'-triphosphate,3'-diphosphate pyrophosphatase
MAETQPRYEFRVWAQNFGDLKERLERHATPVRAVSEETYFVSKTTDRSIVKIRSGLMDIKALIAEHLGLEQWKPVLKAAFPLDRSVIASRVFPCLELVSPRLSRANYAMDEFFDDVMRTEEGIAIAEVSKTRFKFSLETGQAEFASVTINDVPQITVAIESANPDAVLRLIDEFGLGNLPNLSYVRQIKRMLGFGL